MQWRLALLALGWIYSSALAQTYLVVPFSNRTGNPNLDWVGESFSERIRETLMKSGTPVVSREMRESTMRRLALVRSTQHSLASAIKVGEALGCERIIYGSFELTQPSHANRHGSLKVTGRAIDRSRLVQLNDFASTGPLESLDATSIDLAYSVLRWVQPGHPATLDEFRRSYTKVKVTALENYLRGLMAASSEQKHWFFAQAARHDPDFSHPCFHLGRMHFQKENYRESAKWLSKVRSTHPDYLEASFLLGLSNYELANYPLALTAFERVAAVAPAGEIWNNLGAVQALLDDPKAIESLEKALAADPTDPDYLFNFGYVLWQRGAFEKAAEQFRAVLDRNTSDDDATLLLGHALQRTGPRPGDLRIAGLERLKETFDSGDSRSRIEPLPAPATARP
jgi:tetratricopeptide (TPR) repeat protein